MYSRCFVYCGSLIFQSVLDAQRAQNINIMLAKFGKKSYFELAQVRNGDVVRCLKQVVLVQ
jgi:hypothetical protein